MHSADIKAAIERAGLSLSEIGRIVGLSHAHVSRVVAGHSRNARIESLISERTSLPLESLWPQFYGEAMPTVGLTSAREEAREDDSEIAPPQALADLAFIRRYRTRFAAGAGASPDESHSEYLAYRRSYLRVIGVNPKKAACVRIKGDSMEPYLYSGDTVLIDTEDTAPGMPKREPSMRRAFAFEQGDQLRCKIIERDPLQPGMLLISSFSEGYPTEQVPVDDVHIIGRVRNSARTWF